MAIRDTSVDIPASVQSCIELIATIAKPKKIVLFGSRARGVARANSDFDLAVIKRSCTDSEWASLLVDLDELPITLFAIDVVEFELLKSDYKEQIAKDGVVLYESDD